MKLSFCHLITAIALVLFAIPVPAAAQKEGMQLRTVVIDPGHGGKDPGCVSKDQKTYEKNITLDVGKRLAKKIADGYSDVKVIMTRSDDRFVELENRAVIANKANANLFISIHVNAVDKGTTANGYSIHCLGQSKKQGNDLYSKNLDLVKRENSVITLEDNYRTTYQGFDPNDPQSSIIFNLMQNAHLSASLSFAEEVANAMGTSPIKTNRGVSQDPFWVLWRTAMPSVLIEVGFISNPNDLAVMRTEEGRDGIAENIYRAFCSFKEKYDGSMRVGGAPEPAPQTQQPKQQTQPQPVETPKAEEAPKTVETPVAAPETPKVEEAPKAEAAPEELEEPFFGIQILATTKEMDPKDPFFQGYKPYLVKAGKLNKYIIATDKNLREVKKKYHTVQFKFPDSYLVKVENGSSSPVR